MSVRQGLHQIEEEKKRVKNTILHAVVTSACLKSVPFNCYPWHSPKERFSCPSFVNRPSEFIFGW